MTEQGTDEGDHKEGKEEKERRKWEGENLRGKGEGHAYMTAAKTMSRNDQYTS